MTGVWCEEQYDRDCRVNIVRTESSAGQPRVTQLHMGPGGRVSPPVKETGARGGERSGGKQRDRQRYEGGITVQ